MPRPGRKRTRSEADGGGASHRRNRREDDDGGGDEEDDSGGEVVAGPSGGRGGMDVDEHDDADDNNNNNNAQANGSEQRAWRLPAGYNDRHRAFLQAFLARGALSFRQTQPLLAAILNVEREAEATEAAAVELTADDITLDDMREFVDQAKAALAPLDFDIRSATNERGEGSGDSSTDRIWTLVSTDHDPKSHLAVLFPPRKLAFVHRLLGALFDTYNTPRIEALCLTEQQALKLSRPPRGAAAGGGAGATRQSLGEGAEASGSNAAAAGSSSTTTAASRDKGLKHSVVLSLLQSLVRQGWFTKSPQGFYALTTRALLELEPFLVETYNEPDDPDPAGATGASWQRIKYCAACRELITWGLRCATPTCTLRLHDHCEEAFWRTQTGRAHHAAANGQHRHSCPRCDAPWGKAEDDNGDVEGKLHFIGERAITSTDVYRRKRRQGRASEGVDDLMRTLLPRASTGGRGGGGEVAEPFQQAAGRRRSGQNRDENGEGEEE